MVKSHLVKISMPAALSLVLCLLAGCASQTPRQPGAEKSGSGVFIVLPERPFDAEQMFIRFNLARTMAVFLDCDFSVQAGSVRLGTPAVDFDIYGGRGRVTETAEGLRIMEFDMTERLPRPQPADGGERRELVLHARELRTASGEPDQPALSAVKKAVLASGKAAGKVRLASLIHEGGGSFRVVVVLH